MILKHVNIKKSETFCKVSKPKRNVKLIYALEECEVFKQKEKTWFQKWM